MRVSVVFAKGKVNLYNSNYKQIVFILINRSHITLLAKEVHTNSNADNPIRF